MAHTLIRMFREIGPAQQAREALLGSGFDAQDVRLDATEDEAGAASGNFVLPSKAMPDDARGATHATRVRDDHANSQALQRGQYILTVEAGDPAGVERAASIASRFGAVDPERPH